MLPWLFWDVCINTGSVQVLVGIFLDFRCWEPFLVLVKKLEGIGATPVACFKYVHPSPQKCNIAFSWMQLYLLRWILYSRGRVWVPHRSLSSGHRRNSILRWPFLFMSTVFIFTFYLYLREYGVTMGAHFSKNSVTLERIEIFQFCLKIQHLWRLPHPWGGWFGGLMAWGQVKSLKIK